MSSHCQNSLGSRDEYRTAPGGCDLWTKPTGLSHRPAYEIGLPTQWSKFRFFFSKILAGHLTTFIGNFLPVQVSLCRCRYCLGGHTSGLQVVCLRWLVYAVHERPSPYTVDVWTNRITYHDYLTSGSSLRNSLPSHVTALPHLSPSSAVVLNHISSHFLVRFLTLLSFICTVPPAQWPLSFSAL